jgi:hypothetical protein
MSLRASYRTSAFDGRALSSRRRSAGKITSERVCGNFFRLRQMCAERHGHGPQQFPSFRTMSILLRRGTSLFAAEEGKSHNSRCVGHQGPLQIAPMPIAALSIKRQNDLTTRMRRKWLRPLLSDVLNRARSARSSSDPTTWRAEPNGCVEC